MAADSPGPAPRPVAAHVLVDGVDGEGIGMGPEDARHLAASLRLRPGELVGATDGRGGYRLCEYTGTAQLSPVAEVVVSDPRSPRIGIGFVPVKGDRPEWAVQKLTELGVDRIVVLGSRRAVVRWGGPRAAGHLERLGRVARAALMQSRQVWLPTIELVGSPLDLLGDAGVFLAQPGAERPPGPGPATVLIGPEGGWDRAEVEAYEGAGRTVGLGPGVLRAETAAVAAAVIMAALRSGLVGPAGTGAG